MKFNKINKNLGVIHLKMEIWRRMKINNITIGMMSRMSSQVIVRPIKYMKKLSASLTPLIPALQLMMLSLK